jgi:glycosyltransferase involved in cell wall biosynthesis
MKFIINTTNLQSGGALQVASSLLNEWNKHCAQHEFHVCLSPQMDNICKDSKFNEHIHFYSFNQHSSKGLIHLLRKRQQLHQIESRIQADAVLTVFGPGIWKSKAPQLAGFANGYYLFDDSDYIKAKLASDVWKKIYYYGRRWLLLQQLKKEAQYFWVETQKAQKRLSAAINVPSSKIQVIGNCASINTSTTSSQKSNSNKPFRLLYLSAYYEHKNFKLIPKVIAVLQQRGIDCQFCLSLPDADFNRIFGRNNYEQYVQNLGPIGASAISAAYANADAVFMPSLLETFSANYPEAMHMNKPLLCSDLDFARAICGNAAIYFNPFDATDAADTICKLMQDKALQTKLIAAGQQLVSQMETPRSRAEKLVQQLINIATSPVKTNTSCVA